MPMQPRDNVVNNEANKPLSVFMDNEVSYYPYQLLCGGLVYKKESVELNPSIKMEVVERPKLK